MARIDSKTRILTASKAVFAREGYRGATVSHILAEADVARGTFYKYFPNKRQVLFEVVSGIFRSLYDSVNDMLRFAEPEMLEQRMRDSLELSYRMFLENRGVIQVYFNEAFRLDPGLYAIWDDFDRRVLALFVDVLKRGIDAGALRQVDTALVSRAMFLLFMQMPYWDILLGGMVGIDIGSLSGEMVRFVMQGISIGAPKMGSGLES